MVFPFNYQGALLFAPRVQDNGSVFRSPAIFGEWRDWSVTDESANL
jgi:hypothetical protein